MSFQSHSSLMSHSPNFPQKRPAPSAATYAREFREGRYACGLHDYARPLREACNHTTPEIIVFANEGGNERDPVFFPNALGLPDDGKRMIIPFGEYDHRRGLQILGRREAEGVVRQFRGLKTKLANLFRGLPVYVGHPDVPAAREPGADSKAYAWVRKMEILPDGLALVPSWSPAGRELIENGHYMYFSPVFRGAPSGGRRHHITELISVGLTNMPNIPVRPLANDQTKDNEMKEWIQKLLKQLGFSEAQATAFANQADGAPSENEVLGKVSAAVEAAGKQEQFANDLQAATQARTTVETDRDRLKGERDAAQQKFDNERTARIELLVDTAIAETKIPATDRQKWVTDFANGFDAKVTELQGLTPRLKRESTLDGDRRSAAGGGDKDSSAARMGAVREAMEERRVQFPNESYDLRWAAVQRIKPDLFENMKEPGQEAAG